MLQRSQVIEAWSRSSMFARDCCAGFGTHLSHMAQASWMKIVQTWESNSFGFRWPVWDLFGQFWPERLGWPVRPVHRCQAITNLERLQDSDIVCGCSCAESDRIGKQVQKWPDAHRYLSQASMFRPLWSIYIRNTDIMLWFYCVYIYTHTYNYVWYTSHIHYAWLYTMIIRDYTRMCTCVYIIYLHTYILILN